MAGETVITVIGNLTSDPELDRVRTPVDGAEGEDDPLAGPLRDRDGELAAQPA